MIPKTHENGTIVPMSPKVAPDWKSAPLPFSALLEALAGRSLTADELVEVRTRLRTVTDTLRIIAARLEPKHP